MSTSITIGSDVIPVRPDETPEYLVETALVAKGYGVSVETIRTHKRDHADELIEGQHFLSVGKTNARPGRGAQRLTVWTKLGVITLGFFIKSDRAKLFRKAAAALILRHTEQREELSPAFLRRVADAMEQRDRLARVNELLRPRGTFGELSRKGLPKDGLVPPYYRSRMRDRFLAQQYQALQQQIDFFGLLLAS